MLQTGSIVLQTLAVKYLIQTGCIMLQTTAVIQCSNCKKNIRMGVMTSVSEAKFFFKSTPQTL